MQGPVGDLFDPVQRTVGDFFNPEQHAFHDNVHGGVLSGRPKQFPPRISRGDGKPRSATTGCLAPLDVNTATGGSELTSP